MTRQTRIAVFAGLIGIPAGVGAFTFVYAKGFSYLSADPRACVISTTRAKANSRPSGRCERNSPLEDLVRAGVAGGGRGYRGPSVPSRRRRLPVACRMASSSAVSSNGLESI